MSQSESHMNLAHVFFPAKFTMTSEKSKIQKKLKCSVGRGKIAVEKEVWTHGEDSPAEFSDGEKQRLRQ